MKRTALFILGIFLLINSYSQNTGLPGVTKKTYYDYDQKIVHVVGTKYPDGTAKVKEYYKSGVLKVDATQNVDKDIITSAKVYDEYGKLRFSYAKNNNGDFNGEHKIYAYTTDYKTTYVKYYALYKDGDLLKFVSLYAPNKTHEKYDNLEYKEYDENNNLIDQINYSKKDTSCEKIYAIIKFDDGKVVLNFSLSRLDSHSFVKYYSREFFDPTGTFQSSSSGFCDSTNINKFILTSFDKNKSCTYKYLFSYPYSPIGGGKPYLTTKSDESDLENELKFDRSDFTGEYDRNLWNFMSSSEYNKKQLSCADLTDKPIIKSTIKPNNHYIGESFGGGIVFYVYDDGLHGLIAATSDQSIGVQWYNGQEKITDAIDDSVSKGSINTSKIVMSLISDNPTGKFAANVCADYSITVGSIPYYHWYLPTKYELNLLYLQKTVVGGFADTNYWSSSEDNYSKAGKAWNQNFFSGNQDSVGKYEKNHVRAIRSF